ncbi:MAG: 1-phosphofructokinase [Leuconostoc sp.]|uniref:1-phosphofructokinase n=1 Tax=Leuconostoc sp. TaxID=1930076 RepID=UPI0039EA0FF3
MIYTVTLNPSLDYITRVPELSLGETNRATSQQLFPGGKGINVSRLLSHLGIENTALGFLGGFTGTHLQATLNEPHLRQGFTAIAGETRINLKIKAQVETEINATGPAITTDELTIFLQQFAQLTADDLVILSGSIPKSLDHDIYQQIIGQITARQARFVIDTTGEQLQAALQQQPLLVKPNRQELAQLYQVPLTTRASIQKWGHQLLAAGAQHAIVSLAGAGAVLLTPSGDYFAAPVAGQVKNSAGAGDSMIAGFVGTWLASGDVVESFKVAVASGTATAFSEDIATKAMIETIYEQVRVTSI